MRRRTAQAQAGTIVFSVQNTGYQPTEFYVYGEGDEVIGEYTTACKPGMTGEGIRGSFTVE